MTEVDPVEYYGRRGIRPGQIVDVPSSFTDTLRKYFALDRSERDRFLRASFWFQNARTTDSSSAMFTALISAVEALMPSDPGGPSCPECHRSTGPGPTARFATFVDDLAPGIPNQARRRLYSIRSALSHGGSLLPSDRSHLSGAMTQPHLEEWEDILLAEQLVRTTLVNWLRAR